MGRARLQHVSEEETKTKNPPDEQLPAVPVTAACLLCAPLRTSCTRGTCCACPVSPYNPHRNRQKHKEGDMVRFSPGPDQSLPFTVPPLRPSRQPRRLLHSLDSLGLLLLLGGFATHNKRQRKNTCNTHECQRRTRQEQPGSSAGSFLVQSVSPDRLPARALGPQ
jgi:hypothetical protein